MNKIKIIFSPTKEKPYIVIWKPKGLPSAPLTKDDKNNALSQAGELFPEIYNVIGKKRIEYGLVHRLDTATDGLLVIAINQQCYDFIINEQKNGRFIKYYSAVCDINENNSKILDGFPANHVSLSNMKKSSKTYISSYFRGFGKGSKVVRPVTEESGRAALKKLGKQKLYKTEIIINKIDKEKKECTVICKISEGYRHQVRCHLAWIGLPIKNDLVYNANCVKKEEIGKKNAENNMKFSATKLQFECPKGDLNSYEIAFTWT